MSSVLLRYHKLHGFVRDPELATSGSACFDLRCYLGTRKNVDCVDDRGKKVLTPVIEGLVDSERCRYISVLPGHTAMIPTGIILDIPDGHVVKIYGRSGLSMRGLPLANSVGIIDSDYREEIFILLRNTNKSNAIIQHDQRVAQMSLEEVCAINLVEISDKPDRIGSRSGGFGSTGVN
tara:strand:+ start:97 stop:630 length:534 start_codon:yes stop_codon:yes gene_type:complete